jgi:hypothetical protein
MDLEALIQYCGHEMKTKLKLLLMVFILVILNPFWSFFL